MAKKSVPPLGTVSSGTLRTEDLLYAYEWYCRTYGGRKGAKLAREYDRMSQEEAEGEEGEWLLEEMTEFLESLAPEYAYFGTLEGDGACFGYWPSWDSLEEYSRGTNPEVLKVSDTSEVPPAYRGHVVHVNDHGNVTLYWRNGNRQLRELWSVV